MSQILCQCGKKLATIHVTEIVNGEKKEIHLCEDCAKEKKIFFPAAADLSEVLSGMIEAANQPEAQELADLRCPECGITFGEFKANGRFGCPNDYEVFRKGVDPLLERIHGTTSHRGKKPQHEAPETHDDALAQLRAELQEAVDEEAYERAARIRDQIYALKKEQGDAT